MHRAPSWPLAELLHNGRLAMPDKLVLRAFLSLQFLQRDVLAYQFEDFADCLQQHSRIICVQAGFLQPGLRMPAFAAAEEVIALCVVGLLQSVKC